MAEQYETPTQIVASMLARKERSKARLADSIRDGVDLGCSGRHLAHQAGSLLAVEEAIDILKEVLAEITPVSTEFARLQSHAEHCTANTCCVKEA